MRLALIGCTGHCRTYAPALQTIPGLEVGAIAPGAPEEGPQGFADAPGVGPATRWYDDAAAMLDTERPDIVQVATRPDRVPFWARACMERGIPVMAEKPIAMNTAELSALYRVACSTGVPLIPMHTERGGDLSNTMAKAVISGAVGSPLLAASQKTYRWGETRADYFRSRATFPGTVPYIGIHIMDWLFWMLGDVYTEVSGVEGIQGRPDFPACASQAAVLLKSDDGRIGSFTLDYLRPLTAPTHGDERLRVAGTGGMIEMVCLEERITLIRKGEAPVDLPVEPAVDMFTQFVRQVRGEGPAVMSREDAFRITEIVLRAQEAIDTGRPVSLRNSEFTAR